MARMIRRLGARTKQRNVAWNGALVGMTLSTGGVNSQSVITESILEDWPSAVLQRVRGNILVRATSVSAPGAQTLVALGLMFVNSAAFAAGTASLPSPFTDVGTSWLWHAFFPIAAESTTVVNADTDTVIRIEVDGKAKRKIKPNEVLALMAEDVPFAGTIATNITGGLRILIAN